MSKKIMERKYTNYGRKVGNMISEALLRPQTQKF